jgi:uncharacterized membrane protein
MMAATGELLSPRRQMDEQHKHPVNQLIHDEATLGERVADKAAAGIGSWPFLIVQSILIVIWVALNVIGFINRWDPYPFILLNLCFTIQAAFTGPLLLLTGNRQAQKDRLRLEHTAEVAENEEKSTLDILDEIERNTEATLRILDHLQKRREKKAGSGS